MLSSMAGCGYSACRPMRASGSLHSLGTGLGARHHLPTFWHDRRCSPRTPEAAALATCAGWGCGSPYASICALSRSLQPSMGRTGIEPRSRAGGASVSTALTT